MNSSGILNEVTELLKKQADLLIKVATHELSIRDTDADDLYQENDKKLLRLSKPFGMPEPFPWRTLWQWNGYYSQTLPDYKARRILIGSLLREALDRIDELKESQPTLTATLRYSKSVVKEVLIDADLLIREGRYSTAVDRLHTAIHGHLRWICDSANLDTGLGDLSVTKLMRVIRESHPNFVKSATLDEDMKRIFMSMGNILESMNTVRNNASPAHANDILLAEPEARLAVNISHSILSYLDDKTQDET